jgi:hypothetical protein
LVNCQDLSPAKGLIYAFVCKRIGLLITWVTRMTFNPPPFNLMA